LRMMLPEWEPPSSQRSEGLPLPLRGKGSSLCSMHSPWRGALRGAMAGACHTSAAAAHMCAAAALTCAVVVVVRPRRSTRPHGQLTRELTVRATVTRATARRSHATSSCTTWRGRLQSPRRAATYGARHKAGAPRKTIRGTPKLSDF
jgi:hypothetical protein